MRFATILALASSAFAYQVLIPNGSQGWTTDGAQPLAWQRVSTDALNFTVVLSNQKVNNFESQVLQALVDGSLEKTTLNPQNGGWPSGSGFRVRLVRDTQNLNTIFAESVEFTIAPASTTLSRSTLTNTPATTVQAPPTTVSDASSPSDTDIIPPAGGAIAASSHIGALGLASAVLAYMLV